MSVKTRLVILNFTQFFVWGAWLISFGGYMIATLKFTGGQVGSIYSTMGLASLFMPGLLGIVADRWINAERVLGLCHIAGALLLFLASTIKDPGVMYWVMLLNCMVYMPTIALNNAVSYEILSASGFDVVRHFPPIRVWGTVGFIVAMWVVDLVGWTVSPMQLYIASISALALGVYAFTLPACPPGGARKSTSLASALGLDALVLFKNRQMAVFFTFAAFIGAALQITNTFGEAFLHDFKGAYANSFAVAHPGLLMSVSQISETLFILTIPFFLGRFGIKRIMMISICAWVLRFGLFGVGNPGSGLILLVLSMIIYGMAFDFYNISGSLFVELEAEPSIRASAQGLFMIMTNGLGALIGGVASGRVVDYFTVDGVKDWRGIWLVFAAYALVLGLIFPFAFKYKHEGKAVGPLGHAA
jgi:NHS family xanthosine MFS transporter